MKVWEPGPPVRGIFPTDEERDALKHLHGMHRSELPSPSPDDQYIVWRVGRVIAVQPVAYHIHDQDCGRA